MTHPKLPCTSLAQCFPWPSRLAALALLTALVLLGIGVFAPIITLTKLMVIENTFSIVSGAVALFRDGQLLLFIIVFGFSVVFPLAKLILLFLFLTEDWDNKGRLEKHLRWMHRYGRWSMLDVFVVAVLVASVKLGALASIETHYGLYAFAGAVVLTMSATAWVMRLAERAEQSGRKGTA